jgi:hypothetical protein
MTRTAISSSTTAAAFICLLMITSSAPVAAQGARPRGSAPAEGRAGRREQVQPRSQGGQAAAQPAQPQNRASEPERRAVVRAAPQAVQPRQAAAAPRTSPRVVGPGADHPVYRPDYRPNYRPEYRPTYRADIRPDYRPVYRPQSRAYYRPYYAFQPRVHLRFGLWAGYPVAYPYYMYPSVSYPYAYSSAYPATVYPVPGASPAAIGAAGGLSFDIRPEDARVYVDRQYVGVAAQFSATDPPLSLAPGRHRVEIHAPGFEVIAFDVDIVPGQVIPYQGDLRQF